MRITNISGLQQIKILLAGFQSLDRVPWRAGIPKNATSDLEKFEALDPAEWCPRGYAIVNVDSRGIFDSDGDMFFVGTQVSRRRNMTIRIMHQADPLSRRGEMDMTPSNALRPSRGVMERLVSQETRILLRHNGMQKASSGQIGNI